MANRYGSFAMESLINGLLKLGAKRERLEVKLFGGGHVLDVDMNVGDRNIEFVRHWLQVEGYRILAEDQPYTFLFTREAIVLIDRRFKGVVNPKFGYYNYPYFYVPKAPAESR